MNKIKLSYTFWYIVGGLAALGMLTMICQAIRMMWVVLFEM